MQTYSESRGHNFALNATFDDIEFSKYDGLVIPGGRAPEYLAMNPSVLDLVNKFHDSKKPIASICHGQLILAAAGLAKGRKCTAYAAVGPVLVAAGAQWVEPETIKACVVDGLLITGATYEGHPEFIRLFIQALGGNITGSDKRILFLCGVWFKFLCTSIQNYHMRTIIILYFVLLTSVITVRKLFYIFFFLRNSYLGYCLH